MASELSPPVKDENYPWANSVCSACGKADCYGTCPGYDEWERDFIRTNGQFDMTPRDPNVDLSKE